MNNKINDEEYKIIKEFDNENIQISNQNLDFHIQRQYNIDQEKSNSEEEEYSDKKSEILSELSNQTSNKDNEVKIIPEIVDLIFKNFEKKKNSVSYLYKLCKSVKIYYILFKDIPNITLNELVEFTVSMLTNISDFEINPKIEEFILNHESFNDTQYQDEQKFFHQNSKKLSSFIAKLHAASLINLHLIISGPTGIGKTSAARAYSRMRGNFLKLEENKTFYMHPFHFGTKPNHFYGSTILKKEKIKFMNGSLTEAITKGLTFIADEMNLSSNYTMKSLAPVLEENNDQYIYIAGLNDKNFIQKNFFFIACQNDLGTIGRNPLPPLILKRFKELKYTGQD